DVRSAVSTDEACGVLCGDRDGFEWSEAGLDQQLELPMQPFTLHVTRIGCIGPRRQQHAGLIEAPCIRHRILQQSDPTPCLLYLFRFQLPARLSSQTVEKRGR